MKVTVLGCGASMGTPGAGGFWGACDPDEPKNARSRASILVQSETTDLLVDATVDVRLQLNRVGLKKLDALLLSHAHSDHVNGLDDLRGYAYRDHKVIDTYSDKETLDELDRRWPYVYTPKLDIYVEFLKRRDIVAGDSFRVGDIDVQTFGQDHTSCASLGFRFGNFAYSVDVAVLDEAALRTLEGVETWIVDAASYHREHVVTHANLKRVQEWVDRIKPKMTYLTVLTAHMDYKTLCAELPPHIRPAYDGLVIDTAGNLR